MSTLSDIPTADARRAAAAQRAAEAAARQGATASSQLEHHWTRAIAAWCAQPMQDGHDLVIAGIDAMDAQVVSAWVADLSAKGYTAAIDESKNRLTVSA